MRILLCKVLIMGLLLPLSGLKAQTVCQKDQETPDVFVKVSKINEKFIRFERCYRDGEVVCLSLGDREQYSLEELRGNRAYRVRTAWALGIAEGVVVAGCAYGGFMFFGLGSQGSMVAATAGGTAAGGVPAAIALVVDFLNPFKRYNRAQLIKEDILLLEEEDVYYVDDIEAYIDDLDELLTALDS